MPDYLTTGNRHTVGTIAIDDCVQCGTEFDFGDPYYIVVKHSDNTEAERLNLCPECYPVFVVTKKL